MMTGCILDRVKEKALHVYFGVRSGNLQSKPYAALSDTITGLYHDDNLSDIWKIKYLRVLAKSHDSWVHCAIASHALLPHDVQCDWAAGKDQSVIWGLCDNPGLCEDAQRILFERIAPVGHGKCYLERLGKNKAIVSDDLRAAIQEKTAQDGSFVFVDARGGSDPFLGVS